LVLSDAARWDPEVPLCVARDADLARQWNNSQNREERSMTNSTLIARLMGPVLLIMGIGMALGLWMNPEVHLGMMKEFMGSLPLIMLVGVLALVAGLAIVNAHSLWVADWRVIITILGWLAILRGAASLLVPMKVHSLGEIIMAATWGPTIGAVVMLVLGAILTAMGYEGLWKEERHTTRPASSPAARGPKRPRRK
jgi:hypothetical protein